MQETKNPTGAETIKYLGLHVTLDHLIAAQKDAEASIRVVRTSYLTAVTDKDRDYYRERLGLYEDKLIELNALIEELAK